MKILGLNAFGQNPSACLLIDGILVGFSHEERFNRLKGSHGLFPSHTINWLLSKNKLSVSDIDVIAFNWNCNKYPWRRMLELLKTRFELSVKNFKANGANNSSSFYKTIEYLVDYTPGNIVNKIKDELRRFGYKGNFPKIEFIDHHLCHAYQAYYHSPFTEALTLVVDGHGEDNTISGYTVKDGIFKKILNYKIPYSLGWFYGGMTAYLGFFPNRDEGKLMGLAAYGEQRKNENIWISKLDEILKVSDGQFALDPYFFKFGSNDYHPRYTNKLVEFITGINTNLKPVGVGETVLNNGENKKRYLLNEYIDLAYAVQLKLEDALSSIVTGMVKETGIRNLCYAGGVAMNCKANRAVYERCSLENIFIHPASTDDGSSIGAAFYIAAENNELKKQELLHTQYGISYSNEEIEKILKNCNIDYSKPDDVCSIAARLLNEDNVLGWFNGAAEMGARALGGRSIIANPINNGIKNKINSNIKYRESWRPYCPSILEGYEKDYIENTMDTPFMIMATSATKSMQSKFPSVVHIDNTVRPQTVKRNVLPKWAHLLDEFKKFTDHPILLNTSFNIRGEPIINSPSDAIKTFYSTGLDYLILGDFVISKTR